MSIELVSPSSTTTRRVRKHVAYIVGSSQLTTGWTDNAEAGILRLAAPHPIFNLPFHSIASGSDFELAYMTGWRYFLTTFDSVLAAAEMHSITRHEPGTFAQLVRGPLIQSAFALLARAEQIETVKAKPFALGLLRVPALQFHALWLRDVHRGAEKDLFIPIEHETGDLADDPSLRSRDLMARLVVLKDKLRIADPLVTTDEQN
jgi:hypothetical protein